MCVSSGLVGYGAVAAERWPKVVGQASSRFSSGSGGRLAGQGGVREIRGPIQCGDHAQRTPTSNQAKWIMVSGEQEEGLCCCLVRCARGGLPLELTGREAALGCGSRRLQLSCMETATGRRCSSSVAGCTSYKHSQRQLRVTCSSHPPSNTRSVFGKPQRQGPSCPGGGSCQSIGPWGATPTSVDGARPRRCRCVGCWSCWRRMGVD